MKNKTQENREELRSIIDRLSIDPSDRAQEMLASAKARLIAYYDNDYMSDLNIWQQNLQLNSREYTMSPYL